MIEQEEMKNLIGQLVFRDWEFEFRAIGSSATPHLRVVFAVLDIQSVGSNKRLYGRWWRLSRHMVKEEVIQTALKAVLTAVEHEAREEFLYRGRAIFGPHLDVDKLWGIADQTVVREGNK